MLKATRVTVDWPAIAPRVMLKLPKSATESPNSISPDSTVTCWAPVVYTMPSRVTRLGYDLYTTFSAVSSKSAGSPNDRLAPVMMVIDSPRGPDGRLS